MPKHHRLNVHFCAIISLDLILAIESKSILCNIVRVHNQSVCCLVGLLCLHWPPTVTTRSYQFVVGLSTLIVKFS